MLSSLSNSFLSISFVLSDNSLATLKSALFNSTLSIGFGIKSQTPICIASKRLSLSECADIITILTLGLIFFNPFIICYVIFCWFGFYDILLVF